VARFLRDGYRVAVPYRSEADWSALARAQDAAVRGGVLLGVPADLTDADSTRAAIDRAAGVFGGLSALVHLAGGYAGGTPVEHLDASVVRRMMDTNLLTAFWAAKHVLPHVKRSRHGRLLFISSRGAVITEPGASAYAASKAGLSALVLTLAKELRADSVTANAILPSVIDTPANRAAMPDADPSRWVKPEEIAALLAFLASESAASVSGALIPIYGRA
jgi:NAD(P)-dependent dehydrogenase (short-subunit alcohol dehydrogenase family)